MNKTIVFAIWLAIVTGIVLSFSYLFLVHSHQVDGHWECDSWRQGEEYLSRSIIENWVLYDTLFYRDYNATITISNITDYNATVSILQEIGNETTSRAIQYTINDCLKERWVRNRAVAEVKAINL